MEVIFQSTLSQGERQAKNRNVSDNMIFQSTLSQGERPQAELGRLLSVQFQSTLSQGERPVPSMTQQQFRDISIHALARRATKVHKDHVQKFFISIHALARRATCIGSSHLRYRKYFNPRSRKESDSHCKRASKREKDFNPRSRKESDLLWQNWREFNGEFQSTLSQGERHKNSNPGADY